MTKEIKPIQTKIWNTEKKKYEWIGCEATTWNELKEDGWEFTYLDSDVSEGAVVLMVRNGYANEFRNTPCSVRGDKK
jgi:hypothetical protein